MQAKLNAAIAGSARRGGRRSGLRPGRRPACLTRILAGEAGGHPHDCSKRGVTRMISSVPGRCLHRRPRVPGLQLTVRKAVPCTTSALSSRLSTVTRPRASCCPGPSSRCRRRSAISLVVTGESGEMLGCGALPLLQSRRWARSGRSRCTSTPRPTEPVGRVVEALVEEAQRIRAGCNLCFHLRCGILPEGRLPPGRAGGVAAEGVEGLPALPQIPGMRRGGHVAHSPSLSGGRKSQPDLWPARGGPRSEGLIQIPTPRHSP